MEQRSEIIKVLELDDIQKKSVFNLWNREYPVNLVYHALEDFELYLEKNSKITPVHFLVYDTVPEVCGWFFLFDRDGEKWFAMILDQKIQGQGYGSKLLDLAKKYRQDLAGWVIDHKNDVLASGKAYKEPTGFYIKNDFQILDSVRLETEVISAVKIIWKA